MAQTECIIEGCNTQAIARGWCRKHYMRWKRNGDPAIERVNARGLCNLANCGKPHAAAGLCDTHYRAWKKSLEPKKFLPCGICGQNIPEDRRGNNRTCSDECKRVQKRRSNIRREYGLELADYDRMIEAQQGRCAICQGTQPGGKYPDVWKVDHNHDTGAVRGLLCNGCNIGLGKFGDDAVLLAAAIEYLRRHDD